jgi:DNA-binding IclR family transcriptional regulator
LLHTLVTLGMLAKGADNRYLLGLRIGSLAEAFPRHLAPPERLSPYVRQVAHETGETSYAVGWREGEIVTLAVTRGRNAIQAAEVPHGNYGDAHSRASGKLLLAIADSQTRERYLDSHLFTRRTRYTIVEPQALRRELQKIASQGFATDVQEFAEGVSCLAVPLYEGAMPYAVGLSAPAERFVTEQRNYLDIIRRVVAG